jgi:hypothetical protein
MNEERIEFKVKIVGLIYRTPNTARPGFWKLILPIFLPRKLWKTPLLEISLYKKPKKDIDKSLIRSEGCVKDRRRLPILSGVSLLPIDWKVE